LILTGPEITAAAVDGRVRISPFSPDQVNPSSYNVRLGPTLLIYACDVIDAHRPNPTETITIGEPGYVLQPGELYLGHTLEEVGSDRYVLLLFGRSSVGRLGLFVEITAPIGDIGFHGQWTLMLSPVRPLRVYAGMKIGQITELTTCLIATVNPPGGAVVHLQHLAFGASPSPRTWTRPVWCTSVGDSRPAPQRPAAPAQAADRWRAAAALRREADRRERRRRTGSSVHRGSRRAPVHRRPPPRIRNTE
jgi:dCTP deaminase